ncbi:hypothetical protein Z517_08377 [Fonsecaea pedrosoi CBS 271.37]|uniref:Unplaced genomic scaffold supercont1.5, whole genome shotgun sequence n=1 Tax=Fonsecaea pedrosoi CBS 271.37 TaxID=1442368 RepID=A0A0D2H1Q6_9EURO|nr:uncharacterized protein Z517_08377 [Fonsecaea pedrosoi CBS 271.37]KIW78539.1 hypothetical protein Z517_08377 [Fonsecaea pedrosoi CBS 271.37]
MASRPEQRNLLAGVGNDDDEMKRILQEEWKKAQSKIAHLLKGHTLLGEIGVDIKTNRAGEIQDFDTTTAVKKLEEFLKKNQDESNKGGDGIKSFLNVVKSTGSVICDGVSVVFAPAPACFGAVVLLIDGVQSYSDFWENITDLLHACQTCFVRLQDHMKSRTITSHMCKTLVAQLHVFFEICAYANSQKCSLFRKVVGKAKLFFSKHARVKALLTQMDKYLQDEIVSQTLQIELSIADLRADMNLDETEWSKAIARALGFDQREPGLSELGKLYKDANPETGKWIQDNEIFKGWKDGTSGAPVLVLQGASGQGKTFIMARVVQMLSALTSRGAILAYYFGQQSGPRAQSSDPSEIKARTAHVVRSILWQCAEADKSLAKSMASIIGAVKDVEGSEAFHDSIKQWEYLLVDNDERNWGDIFILIDGFESCRVVLPMLEALDRYDYGRIRIFLTSSLEGWKPSQSSSVKSQALILGQHNSEDLATYITSAMSEMRYLKDSKHLLINQCRLHILENLPSWSRGDYYKITTFLQEISTTQREEVIRAALEKVRQGPEEQIKSYITELNKTLDEAEIFELNEIIMWITSGRRSLTLAEMDAAVKQKHARQWFSTLMERVAGTYKLVLSISPSGSVVWRDPSTEFYIAKRRPGTADVRNEPTVAVHRSELDIVRGENRIIEQFLRLVCPSQAMFDHFKFKDFLGARTGHPKPAVGICMDPVNANIHMALVCFGVLTEAPKDGEKRSEDVLRGYALENLLDHLTEVDLSLVDEVLKTEAGPLLARLFTDPNAIDAFFWTHQDESSLDRWDNTEGRWLGDIRRRLIRNPDGLILLSSWFKDEVVVAGIAEESHRQLTSAFAHPQADQDHMTERIFRPAAERLVRHLFESSRISTRRQETALDFLKRYLSKPEETTGDENNNQDGSTFKLSLKQVERIEDWARSVLFPQGAPNANARDALFQIHMSRIFRVHCHDHGEAKSRAERALRLDPNNILAKFEVGWYEDDPIEMYEDALAHIGDPDVKLYGRIIASVKIELGDLYLKSDKEDRRLKAPNTYLEGLKYNCTWFESYGQILDGYGKRSTWDEFVKFVEEFNSHSHEWKPHLDDMVCLLLKGRARCRNFALAAETVPNGGVVYELYETALELANKDKDVMSLFYLCLSYGTTLGFTPKKKEAIAQLEGALHHAQDLENRERDGNDAVIEKSDISNAAEELARLYLYQALAPDVEGIERQKSGQKLEELLRMRNEAEQNVIMSCCAARYHLSRGEHEKKMGAVQRISTMASHMLEDDTPSNDLLACTTLAQVTTSLGKESIAIDAWKLVHALGADHADSGSVCDGCGKKLDLCKGFYTCEDCVGLVLLDQACYATPRVKPGAPGLVCDRRHTFIHVPRWDETNDVSDSVDSAMETFNERVKEEILQRQPST